MADQDEWRKKAFDYASDTAKQIITLSTGILALTITFAKDILGSISSVAKGMLMFAWLVYLVSIFFGLMTLLTLTGTLDSWSRRPPPIHGATPQNPPSIYASNISRPAKLQILSFLVATFFIFLSGGFSTCGHTPTANPASPTTSPSPSVTYDKICSKPQLQKIVSKTVGESGERQIPGGGLRQYLAFVANMPPPGI